MKELSMLLRERIVIVVGFLIILIVGIFIPKPLILAVVGLIFAILVLVNWQVTSQDISNELFEYLEGLKNGNYDLTMPEKQGKIANSYNALRDSIKVNYTTFSNSSAQMATSAEELSSTAQGLAERAAQQRISVTGMLTSVEEVAQVSGESNGIVVKVVVDVQQVSVIMGTAVETMREVKNYSHQITETINVISDIADQTNLLALNAAIEAARAGEHGKGFAVVADEVRKLAEKSAGSAKEIIDVVRASSTIVDKGTQLVESTGSELAKAVENINVIARKLQDISTSIVDQLGMVSSLDEMSKANTTSAQEIGAAAEELSAQATAQGNVLLAQKQQG